ncbi:ATP-dependent DNA helicase PcrA, partial [Patescibacteria group bacterium]|nr:ATP-dependent DNA helicase PcrA [Patescibacteria group bacterium]
CYVAITRAKENLYLTHADSRLYFGNRQSNAPSRFLFEIPKNLIENVGIGSTGFKQKSFGVTGRKQLTQDIDSFLDKEEVDRNNFNWE